MDFFDAIESIQQKPLHKKKQLLAASVFIIMLAIIGIWLSLPDTKYSKNITQEKNTNITQTAGPFDILKDEIKKTLQDFSSSNTPIQNTEMTDESIEENALTDVPLQSNETIMEPVGQ